LTDPEIDPRRKLLGASVGEVLGKLETEGKLLGNGVSAGACGGASIMGDSVGVFVGDLVGVLEMELSWQNPQLRS
jgi:hypothetical protein